MAELNEYIDNYQKKISSFEDRLKAISFGLNENLEKIRGASDDIEALNLAVIELAEIVAGGDE